MACLGAGAGVSKNLGRHYATVSVKRGRTKAIGAFDDPVSAAKAVDRCVPRFSCRHVALVLWRSMGRLHPITSLTSPLTPVQRRQGVPAQPDPQFSGEWGAEPGEEPEEGCGHRVQVRQLKFQIQGVPLPRVPAAARLLDGLESDPDLRLALACYYSGSR